MNVLLLLQERTRIQQALLHSPPGHLVYHKGRYGAQQYTRPSDHKRVQKYIRMKDLPQMEARYREKGRPGKRASGRSRSSFAQIPRRSNA